MQNFSPIGLKLREEREENEGSAFFNIQKNAHLLNYMNVERFHGEFGNPLPENQLS